MLQQSLKTHFGFDQFREGQEAVISTILDGRSAAAIFPTGSGKSLCYQLPAIHLPHLTLVISPLLALMQDQVQSLNHKGIAAANIDSSKSREQVNDIMAKVTSGEIKILMVAVERLKNERFRQFIQQIPISLLVIDEAHCISEWGHNFRPDYLKLPGYKKLFNIPQVLLLTATATPQVIADMASKFAIQQQDITVTGFYRKNLNLAVEGVSDKHKLVMLEQWLFHEARYKPHFKGDVRVKRDRSALIDPTIVYVTLQHTAEVVAKELLHMGFNAKAYHAGINSDERHIIQTDFMAGNIDIIVATIAFGMGIDKADIRHVVHYDLPKSIENYSQEVGRAGRDGQPSDCLVLVNRDSLNVLENFIYGDTPEYSGIQHVLNDINQNQENGRWQCQIYSLSSESNIRQLPLKTLLVYLEIQGLIQPLYSYFAEYKFKLLVDKTSLINTFSGERQAFVQAILEYSNSAKIWWTADIESICGHYSRGEPEQDRSRVIRALEYFEQQGLIELQSKQMTEVFRVNVQQIDVVKQAQNLSDYFSEKEQTEVARIHNMLDLFERHQCLSFQLASYFGDTKAPVHCGHCSVCKGHKIKTPLRPELPMINNIEVTEYIAEFQRAYLSKYSQDASPALLVKFLLGISTPVMTKLKARALSGFGKLEQYPYSSVMQFVQ